MSSTFGRNMEIGEKLKQLRKELNLSQDDFAKALGIGSKAYWNYENNKRSMPSDILSRIVRLYGLNLNWLFCGIEPMFQNADNIYEIGNSLNKNQNLKQNYNKNISTKNLYKNFGKIQEVNGLSDREMARILKTSEDIYTKYASGRELPPTNILVALKENFNIDLDEFMFGENNAPTDAGSIENFSAEEIAKLKKLLKNL